MRTLLATLLILISTLAVADLGTATASKEELAKAPAWPKPYKGNPEKCKRVNEQAFMKQENIKIPKEETPHGQEADKYYIESQVDLNLDGVCEIIALERCYAKWCSYFVYQLKAGRFVRLGEILRGGEYLEPHNGWLQIKSMSYTGATYFYHLSRFEDGAYRSVRRDEYKEIFDKKSRTPRLIYVGTENRR